MSGNRKDGANFRSVQELHCIRDVRHARTYADGGYELHGTSPDDGRDAGDVAHDVAICNRRMSPDEGAEGHAADEPQVKFCQRGELYLYVQK